MSRIVTLVCVLFLVVYCLVSSGLAEPERAAIARKPRYSWRQTDSSLALLNHGRIVWQLNFNKKEGKPCFHPVGLIDGTELTWLRPADHRWHRALWFSWKYINGLNYWEEDPKTGLSEGRTEVVDVKLAPGDDYSARIVMSVSYHPPDKPAVLIESRFITVSAPDDSGQYHIDWLSGFTAGRKDVVLDRTPLPGEEGGKGYGGYAGLSVRMAKATRGWQFVDSEGRKDKEAHGKRAKWVNFSGEIGGDKAAGITIFDHPDNLRHPSPWYVEKGMPYFSPAVLFDKAYTLAAGKSLTLRYRILIHPGLADKVLLEGELKAFLKTTDIEVRMESANKLLALGTAMVTYSGDYEVKFPDDMRALHKYGNLKKKDLEWLLENVVYLGKGRTDSTIQRNTVLAYDKTLLEEGEGTNVLFGDSRIDFLRPEQLKKLGIKERKTAIRVDLLVCEVYADKRIDAATFAKVKDLIGERIESGSVANLPDKVLRAAVQSEQVPKDKLDSLVDLLGSKGYLKILMNPTLEVVDGQTGKVRASYKGPAGKDIVDSFEVTPRVLDDGCISLETEAAIGEMRITNDENRFKNGQSLVIGGIRKTLKRHERRVTETMFIVTATICTGD
jgi:hypothetical protein